MRRGSARRRPYPVRIRHVFVSKPTMFSSASPSAMKPVFATERRCSKRSKSFFFKIPAMSAFWPPKRLGRPRGLDAATVHRGHVTNGPKFSHFSAGVWLPPQASKLEEKLRPGRYRSDLPMELFAYAIHDEPDLAVGSLELLQDVIAKLLPESSFRRAHGFRRHLYTYPG